MSHFRDLIPTQLVGSGVRVLSESPVTAQAGASPLMPGGSSEACALPGQLRACRRSSLWFCSEGRSKQQEWQRVPPWGRWGHNQALEEGLPVAHQNQGQGLYGR